MASQQDDERERKVRELLAEAMRRLDEEGEESLESFYAEHAAHAESLRRRMSLLGEVGMLAAEDADPGDEVPERLGEYRLGRRLGGGGMGVVYLAEQESLQRQVALKVIRPELLYFPKSRERFRREIEAASQLQHPSIVRVYAAGEQGRLPYFTMELVEGASLDRLLQHLRGTPVQRLGSQTLRAALCELSGSAAIDAPSLGEHRSWVEICCEWMRDLAEALAYAHRTGVLHRDLKPANVMITWSGRAMLLDFGLASTREGGRITRSGSQVGSLPYMAPEQIRGEKNAVDARTDVYALGVTMYEVLTLQSAFHSEGSNDEEVRQRIAQSQVTAPRRHNPSVGWDAETVCLCAMAPEPARRYQSAADLASDLRNVLELRPLIARRPSIVASFRRFVRRRPATSVALGMGFLLFTVAPTAIALREHALRREIGAARAETLLETETREETLRFLNDDLLAAVAPEEAGRDASLRKVLDQASERIEGRFPDRPRVEAAIRCTLGHTYRKLGVLDLAERHLTRAVELSRIHLGARHRKTLEAEHRLASVFHAAGRDVEAEALERRVFEISRAELGLEDPDTLASANNLGQQLTGLGRHEEAVAVLRELVELRLRLLGEGHEDTQTAMSNLGLAYYNWGRLDEAERWMVRELELCRRTKGEDHPHTLIAQNNWANVLFQAGRFEEALDVHERVVEVSRRVRGERHYGTVTSLVNCAKTLAQLGRHEDAQACGQEAIAAAVDLAPDHPALLDAKLFAISNLQRLRRHEEALLLAEELVSALPPDRPDLKSFAMQARMMRAACCEALGRVDDAAGELGRVLEELSSGDDVLGAIARTHRARCWRTLGRHADAESDLLTAHRFYAEHASQDRKLGHVLGELVNLYEAWNRPADAALWRTRLELRQAARDIQGGQR